MIDSEYLANVEKKFSGMLGPTKMLSSKASLLDITLWGYLYYSKAQVAGYKPSITEKLTARAWCARFDIAYETMFASIRISYGAVGSILHQTLIKHDLITGSSNLYPIALMRMSSELSSPEHRKYSIRRLDDCAYLYTPNKALLIIKSKTSDDMVMYGDRPSAVYANDPYGFMFTLIEDYDVFDEHGTLNKEFLREAISFLNIDEELFCKRFVDLFLNHIPNNRGFFNSKSSRTDNLEAVIQTTSEVLGLFYDPVKVALALDMYELHGDHEKLKSMLISKTCEIQAEPTPVFD